MTSKQKGCVVECKHEKVSFFRFYEEIPSDRGWLDKAMNGPTVRYISRWGCEDCQKELQPVWRVVDEEPAEEVKLADSDSNDSQGC